MYCETRNPFVLVQKRAINNHVLGKKQGETKRKGREQSNHWVMRKWREKDEQQRGAGGRPY